MKLHSDGNEDGEGWVVIELSFEEVGEGDGIVLISAWLHQWSARSRRVSSTGRLHQQAPEEITLLEADEMRVQEDKRMGNRQEEGR